MHNLDVWVGPASHNPEQAILAMVAKEANWVFRDVRIGEGERIKEKVAWGWGEVEGGEGCLSLPVFTPHSLSSIVAKVTQGMQREEGQFSFFASNKEISGGVT